MLARIHRCFVWIGMDGVKVVLLLSLMCRTGSRAQRASSVNTFPKARVLRCDSTSMSDRSYRSSIPIYKIDSEVGPLGSAVWDDCFQLGRSSSASRSAKSSQWAATLQREAERTAKLVRKCFHWCIKGFCVDLGNPRAQLSARPSIGQRMATASSSGIVPLR